MLLLAKEQVPSDPLEHQLGWPASRGAKVVERLSRLRAELLQLR